jgi:hypothetical protein
VLSSWFGWVRAVARAPFRECARNRLAPSLSSVVGAALLLPSSGGACRCARALSGMRPQSARPSLVLVYRAAAPKSIKKYPERPTGARPKRKKILKKKPENDSFGTLIPWRCQEFCVPLAPSSRQTSPRLIYHYGKIKSNNKSHVHGWRWWLFILRSKG